MAGVVLLKGSVKHYDWGGYDFIPSLLHVDNSKKKPFAEYWLGTHPQAHNMVLSENEEITLSAFLQKNHADELPFLFKVLDVKNMLSIQVHPSKEEAEKGFEEENKKAIPLTASHRNYKDDNHKPEMMVALGDFWLLHGFKPEGQMKKTLTSVKELNSLLPVFGENNYSGLYKAVMEMSQSDVNNALQPLLDRILPLYQKDKLDKGSEDFWAARAAISFADDPSIDRGIFSVYLFNLVNLRNGEAVFQDAGVPHAYLEGRNIELMASSDNVLRGGLTSKHVDVPELLRLVKCEATRPSLLQGDGQAIATHFKVPVPDFELTVIQLRTGEELEVRINRPQIILLTSGEVNIKAGNDDVMLEPGEPSALLLPGIAVITADKDAFLFKAAAGRE